MSEKDTILQELNELKSTLPTGITNPYAVPTGYFDALADTMLAIIKQKEESLLMAKAGKQMPYSVPEGYFDGLAEAVVNSQKNANLSPLDELKSLSPLLSGINKKMPYDVPVGYFDQLSRPAQQPGAKLIPLTKRKWFLYAAAAVITGIIVLAGLIMFNNKAHIDPNEDSYAWVKSSLNKISTDNIDSLVQLVEEDNTVANTKTVEIKELVKDVPEQEIQSLLKDAEALELDDAILN